MSAEQTPPASTVPPLADTAPASTPGTSTPDTGTPATTPATALPTPDTGPPPIVEPELSARIPIDQVVDIGSSKPPQDHDEFVAVALSDIERWWNEIYPDVYGEPFVPLAGGVYAGYPDRDTEIPGCGADENVTSYPDLQLFVAFYCEFGDFMAYDDGDGPDSLLTPLANEYGSAVMGIVLAHEFGHAIQQRIGALDQFYATIVTEQQADCFAGAWTGQAYRGESPLLRLGDTDVRAGLLAMLSVRDPVGVDQFVPGGHGSAFDRVGAFQEGFSVGPARCAELLDQPLPLMPNQFQTGADLQREGNASYDCSDDASPDCVPAPVFLADDLNDFWLTALGDFSPVTPVAVGGSVRDEPCDGRVDLTPEVSACSVDRTVLFDEPEVLQLYADFGDFTLGYFYGISWAELVQQQMGSQLVGEPRALVNDCFTGAWVRDITPDDTGATPRGGVDRDGDGTIDGITSSPGDLDEAIQMAILEGDEGANVDRVGSPFEKIASFREGVLGGLDACTAMMG